MIADDFRDRMLRALLVFGVALWALTELLGMFGALRRLPLLLGWINYFRLTESKGILEDLDGWVWRRLRCLLWRQWKRPATRARKLRALGMEGDRAFHSARNGQGPWWNAGASHMNHALPAKYFTAKGLVSLMGTHQRLQSFR